MSFKPVALKTV